MSEVNEVVQRSDELARIFFENKVFDLAVKQSEITLVLDPLNPSLFFNAARCHYYNFNYDKAIEYIRVALMLDPNNENSKRELSLYLAWIGKNDESVEILKSLPQDQRTKFNLGWYELRKGNIKEGFELLECGRNINCWGANLQFPLKKWNKTNIAGKKLLVVNDGGAGDEIIFSRFLKGLTSIGAEVTVKPSKELKSIFERFKYIQVVEEIDYDDYDYWIPSMSLPFAMGVRAISGKPYLTPDQKYVDKWSQIIDSDKLKIGIRWEGGDLYEYHQRRTLPVNYLVSKLKYSGELYSLQKSSKDDCPDGVINLEEKLESWEDTIAVISLMDTIVTSCTATAHIAGALGKKTIVIVPILSYFTWAVPGSKTDWYDSVYIIRQTNPYDWDEPIKELKKIMEDY